MTGRYDLNGANLSVDELQPLLPEAHRSRLRPRCMCVPGGVPMYVALYDDFVLKRMPDTGPLHHPTCDSFEPGAAVSGRHELRTAITTDDDLRIHLVTGFALWKRAAPGTASSALEPAPEGKSLAPRDLGRARKCSLAGFTHLLWEEADLNRWHPRMQGKRGQWTLHKYLEREAQRIYVANTRLAERLYVPEAFRVAEKDAIAERRRQRLSFLSPMDDAGNQPLGLMIGEFAQIREWWGNTEVQIKHAADLRLRIAKSKWARIEERFRNVLSAAGSNLPGNQQPHVLMAGIVSSSREGVYQIEAVTMMLMSSQWIPLEGSYEIPMVERLIAEQRMFLKPLSYGMKSTVKLPTAVLLDAGDAPVNLYYISPSSDEQTREIRIELARQQGSGGWVWDGLAGVDPALPRPAQFIP
jgi:hypothetical protein